MLAGLEQLSSSPKVIINTLSKQTSQNLLTWLFFWCCRWSFKFSKLTMLHHACLFVTFVVINLHVRFILWLKMMLLWSQINNVFLKHWNPIVFRTLTQICCYSTIHLDLQQTPQGLTASTFKKSWALGEICFSMVTFWLLSWSHCFSLECYLAAAKEDWKFSGIPVRPEFSDLLSLWVK